MKKIEVKDNVKSFSNEHTYGNERHVIKGVPHVSQETGFYCSYACPTMIFNFFGLNTSLHEVLYNSGVGYNLIYPSSNTRYLPVGGTIGAQWSNDRMFLASLYGLSYESWKANRNLTDNKRWQEYWIRIKQVLKKNIPVKTTVNQIYLPSVKKYLATILFNNRIIQNLLLKYLPPGIHDIVLVGFDEENGAVCYHDPQYGVFGSAKDGAYIWLGLADLRKAVSSAKIGNRESNYSIEIFKKNSNSPRGKKEVFEIAQKRNIEKMKGSPSVYDGRYQGGALGINALKMLKKDLKGGIENSSNILFQFKRIGLRLNLYYKFRDFFLGRLDYNPVILDTYACIALEKQFVLQYLEKNSDLSTNYLDEKQFLRCEVEKWIRLASYFSMFIEKNILMRKTEALNLVKNMSRMIDKLIVIENEIINGYKQKKK